MVPVEDVKVPELRYTGPAAASPAMQSRKNAAASDSRPGARRTAGNRDDEAESISNRIPGQRGAASSLFHGNHRRWAARRQTLSNLLRRRDRNASRIANAHSALRTAPLALRARMSVPVCCRPIGKKDKTWIYDLCRTLPMFVSYKQILGNSRGVRSCGQK